MSTISILPIWMLAARYPALQCLGRLELLRPAGLAAAIGPPRAGRATVQAAILGVHGGCWIQPGNSKPVLRRLLYGCRQRPVRSVAWQAQVGLGYSFGWSDLSLSYRHLYYNPGDSTRLIENLTLYGRRAGMDVSSFDNAVRLRWMVRRLLFYDRAGTGGFPVAAGALIGRLRDGLRYSR